MRLDITKGPLNISMSATWSGRTEGVNSRLKDGNHFLMWDFDNTPLDNVIAALQDVQLQFSLPHIVILQSSVGDNYHAMSFKRTDYGLMCYILAETRRIDMAFFKIGVVREFWTLRIKPKKGFQIKTVRVLENWRVPRDCDISDVAETISYWTKRA